MLLDPECISIFTAPFTLPILETNLGLSWSNQPKLASQLLRQSIVVGKGVIGLVERVPLHAYADSLAPIPAVDLLDPSQRHIGAGADARAGPQVAVDDPPGLRDPVDLIGMLDRLDPVEGGFVGRRVPALHLARPRQHARPRTHRHHVVERRVVHAGAQPVDGRLRRVEVSRPRAPRHQDHVEGRRVGERVRREDELREVRRRGRAQHPLRHAVEDRPVDAERVQAAGDQGQRHVVVDG